MTENTNDYLESLYRSEAKKGEYTAFYFRWVLVAVLSVISAVMVFTGKKAGYSGLGLVSVALVYNIILVFIIKKDELHRYIKYISVSSDIILITLFNFFTSLFQSPEAVGSAVIMYLYPTLIFLAALRHDKKLIVYATLLTVVLNNLCYFVRYPYIPREITQKVYMLGIDGQIFKSVYLLIFGFFVLRMPDIILRLMGQQKKFFENTMSGYNRLSDRIRKSAEELDRLGKNLESNSSHVTDLVRQINDKIGETRKMTGMQSASFDQSAESYREMIGVSGDLFSMIDKQNESISESSAAVQQMVANIRSVSDSTQNAENNSAELIDISEKGKNMLGGVIHAVGDVAKKSENLKEIVGLIMEIAEKTDMLAMNAAIQAAHAGEYGRGFAVVAGEIRNLAEQTQRQSEIISGSLADILNSIESAVRLSGDAQESFENILHRISGMSAIVREISVNMKDQSGSSQRIIGSLARIDDASRNVGQSGGRLKSQTEKMDREMSALKDANRNIDSNSAEIYRNTREIDEKMGLVFELSKKNKESIEAVLKEVESFRIGSDGSQ